jgi:hypothetical protein
MHDECVPESVAGVAERIGDMSRRHGLALGGGTACSLHLGHRVSRDLDFFALRELDPSALLTEFHALGPTRLRGITGTELALLLDDVDVFATSLGRRPLDEPDEWRGIRVLGLDDLAELKLHAAVERGMVRDLCDLHLLCLAGADLDRALEAGRIDAVVALKALTDPDRFGGQPALALHRRWSPDEATAYFADVARERFG